MYRLRIFPRKKEVFVSRRLLQPSNPVEHYPEFTLLNWMFRFIKNACSSAYFRRKLLAFHCPDDSFPEKLRFLSAKLPLWQGSRLLPLRPLLDESQSLQRFGNLFCIPSPSMDGHQCTVYEALKSTLHIPLASYHDGGWPYKNLT